MADREAGESVSSSDSNGGTDALEQADAVIEVMTSYMDDLLDRARQVNAMKRNHPDATAGAYAMYAEARLDELARKVAEISGT